MKRFLTQVLKIIAGIILIPFGVVVSYILFFVILNILGYHIGNGSTFGEEVAMDIANREGSPEECGWIYQYDLLMGPSTGSVRASCYYQLAYQYQDPTICEKILPSDYGIGCIGNVLSSVEKNDCSIDFFGDVVCHGDNHGNYSKEDCQNNNLPLQIRDWCYLSKIIFFKTINDCKPLIHDDYMFELCNYKVADKQHEESACEAVSNPIRKAVCIERAKAWKKYPQLRDSFVKMID